MESGHTPATHVAEESVIEPARPVGALERFFYRYSERNPVHFLMVAEFDEVLAEDEVKFALAEVRRRHPLTSVHVADLPADRLTFVRASDAAGIPLSVRSNTTWQALAAEELSRPFDRTVAPLMRAVLLTAPSQSVILLTFDHTIADGISSVKVLSDLVAALNGQPLNALTVPAPVEALIAGTLSASEQPPLAEPPAEPDPRLLKATSIRAFDGTPPHVHAVALSKPETASLVERCRQAQTTVHSAIVTAASRVRSHQLGDDYVRAMSPINIRRLLNAGGECADYFCCVVTGMAPRDGEDFWDQARTTTRELGVARSAPGVQAAAAAVEAAIGVDADVTAAEALITAALPFELLVTNLGVQDLDDCGPIRPSALWAPVVEAQIAGGVVIGITTYQGVLRMVASGYAPNADFLDAIATALREGS